MYHQSFQNTMGADVSSSKAAFSSFYFDVALSTGRSVVSENSFSPMTPLSRIPMRALLDFAKPGQCVFHRKYPFIDMPRSRPLRVRLYTVHADGHTEGNG